MGKLKEDWKVASKKRRIDFVTLMVSMFFCGGIGIYSALLFLFSSMAGRANWWYCLCAGVMCVLLYILARHRIIENE